MIAAAMTFVILSIFGLVLMQKRNERLEARHDRLLVTHSRTCDRLADERQKHLTTMRRAARAEARLRETEASLVQAGSEAATHANHLTAVMDAMAEGKPLTLVRGGRA